MINKQQNDVKIPLQIYSEITRVVRGFSTVNHTFNLHTYFTGPTLNLLIPLLNTESPLHRMPANIADALSLTGTVEPGGIRNQTRVISGDAAGSEVPIALPEQPLNRELNQVSTTLQRQNQATPAAGAANYTFSASHEFPETEEKYISECSFFPTSPGKKIFRTVA